MSIKVRLHYCLWAILYRIVEIFLQYLYRFIYFGKPRRVSPVKDLIFNLSALQIAHRIRNREVSFSKNYFYSRCSELF